MLYYFSLQLNFSAQSEQITFETQMCSVDNINATFRETVIMNYLPLDLLLKSGFVSNLFLLKMLTFKHFTLSRVCDLLW